MQLSILVVFLSIYFVIQGFISLTILILLLVSFAYFLYAMSLHCLPQSTIKLIGSSQVITSVSAAVKELVENSLDAGASSIEVKLENHGMDKIEVRDDGCGISKNDVPLMCKKSYTSKISCFSDLDGLHSYGFRGEALNALCAVSKLTITTKTADDNLAFTYFFDNNGCVVDSKPSHVNKGTIITAEGLFRNLPVRRQFLTNGRRRSEEIKKVESVVKSLSIIHSKLRLTFSHNKFLIWQKNSVGNLKLSLAQAIPPTIISQLDSFNYSDSTSNIEIYAILPRKDCNISVTCYSNREESIYLFINSRSIRNKELEKVVEAELFQYFGHYIPANKYPLCLLSLKIPPDGLDVNLEPNKTRVVIKDIDYLLDKIKFQFLQYYTGVQENVDAKTPVDIKIPKRKFETESGYSNSQDNVKVPKIDATQNDSTEECCSILNSQDISADDISNNIESTESKFLKNCVDKTKLNDSNLDANNSEDIFFDAINCEVTSSNGKEINVLQTQSEYSCDMIDSQEFDDLETIFATSSHSSVVATPELNLSKDCFECDEHISQGSSQNKITESLECNFDNVKNCSSIGSGKGNVCEVSSDLFLVGTFNESINDSSTSNNDNNKEINCEQSSSMICNRSDILDRVKGNSDESNIENISLSQWSKGHILDSTDIPVVVKQRDEYTSSSHQRIPDDNATVDCFPPDKLIASSYDDTNGNSQTGCKNVAAFTKFAREMRAKIIQQEPGISFTRVASELASKWRDLNDDEKNQYQELALKEKILDKEKKMETTEPKFKQSTIKTCSANFSKGLKKIKYDKVSEIEISVCTLRSRMGAKYFADTDFPQIIGKLSEDLYCFISDDGISALSASRLNEVINFYNNMSTMAVPLKILEKNISIKPEDLGNEYWHALQCLETSVDLKNNTIIIANEFITKNGFRIEVSDGAEGKQFEITDVPTHVSFYGVEDLKEILELMEKHGTTANLLNCRPLKIASYIRSETIRNCSQSTYNFESKGRDSMFNFWIKNVRRVYPNCPHHKPVSKVFLTESVKELN